MLKTKLDESLRNEIIKRLKENFNISELILFGSYACGEPGENSDIDILIVLDENGMAEKYWDKIERRMKVSVLFTDIKKTIPMDFLVYTRDEWKLLNDDKSAFIADVLENGISLL